jgi:hypothetical protein
MRFRITSLRSLRESHTSRSPLELVKGLDLVDIATPVTS